MGVVAGTRASMPERAPRDKIENGPLRSHLNKDMLMHMKRTTLQIDPALVGELRRRAAVEQRTLTEVLERTLRAGLAAPAPGRRARVSLPSYDLGPFLADPARPGRPPGPGEEEPST